MKGENITAYTTRFNILATLFMTFVTPKYKKIDWYIWGLDSQIQGHVTSSKPNIFESVKRVAFNLINKCIHQGTLLKKEDISKVGDYERKSNGKSRGNSKHSLRKKENTGKVNVVVTPDGF